MNRSDNLALNSLTTTEETWVNFSSREKKLEIPEALWEEPLKSHFSAGTRANKGWLQRAAIKGSRTLEHL